MKISRKYLAEAVAEEMKKSDILKYIKNDKDFEKRIKEIIADSVVEILRSLYQHNTILKSIIK